MLEIKLYKVNYNASNIDCIFNHLCEHGAIQAE